MLIQTLVVAVLVLGCAVYARWPLMPAGIRRRGARHLLQVPAPAIVSARLRRHAAAAGGGGCDGGGHATTPADPAQAQPTRLHRRVGREAVPPRCASALSPPPNERWLRSATG